MLDGKDKEKSQRPQGPGFMVGIDNRPVRWPMTDETFAVVREEMLRCEEVVSVELLDGKTLKIVKKANATQDLLMKQLGDLLLRFHFSNPTVIQSETHD